MTNENHLILTTTVTIHDPVTVTAAQLEKILQNNLMQQRQKAVEIIEFLRLEAQKKAEAAPAASPPPRSSPHQSAHAIIEDAMNTFAERHGCMPRMVVVPSDIYQRLAQESKSANLPVGMIEKPEGVEPFADVRVVRSPDLTQIEVF